MMDGADCGDELNEKGDPSVCVSTEVTPGLGAGDPALGLTAAATAGVSHEVV